MLGNVLDGRESGPEALNRLQRVSAKKLQDWAVTHAVEAILFQWIANLGDRLTDSSIKKMARLSQQTIVRDMINRTTTISAVRAISEVEPQVMVIRGISLGATVYPASHLKQSADVDVYIRREKLEACIERMKKLGYDINESKMDEWEPRGEAPMSHKTEPRMVELHWKLITSPSMNQRHAVDYGGLWKRREELEIDGTTINCFDITTNIIFCCIHAAAHHQLDKLARLVDIRQMIAVKGDDIDWDRVIKKTRDANARLAVFHALNCAKRLLGAQPPDEALAAIRPGGLWSVIGKTGLTHGEALRGRTGRISIWRRKLFREAVKRV